MKNNEFFPKQQSKLKREAVLRSLLSGLSVGLGANFIAALVTWLLPINGFWISIGVLVGVTLIATPIFYFKRFLPNNVTSARRIDRLGLEERLITMVELDGDETYIAKRQREDAFAALETVDSKQLKIRVSKAIIIAVAICAVLGTGMTTVNLLGEYGILPSGHELLQSLVKEKTTVYVMVTYIANKGGVIEGDEAQIVVQGSDAVSVTAVADDGYIFKCWSDGNANPTRTDIAIEADITFTAEFMELEDDGDGDDDGLGDQPLDAISNVGGDQSGQGKGDGADGSNAETNKDTDSAGGRWEDENQVIDNETFYRDVLEEYQDAAEELLKDPDSNLTDAEKELIKKYFGVV